MKIKAPVLPLLAGVVLGAVSLTLPWLVARRYQDALGQTVIVERYMYYLWGHSYTVYGKEDVIQTIYSNYIQNIFQGIDFPVISMVLMLVSIVLGLVSLLGGRGTVITIRGKQIRIKPFGNPLLALFIAGILPLLAWLYLQLNVYVITELHRSFEIINGPANDFMLGSFVAYLLTAAITFKRMRDEKGSG